ncbi:hypothetical protein FOQG_10871 [Fusarium oxysporum f. sp. raphani 54005]|uniref:GIY-YIG domain-containing protein n=2 Tax=Fusarium oxysporum f. sp. raphani TaxID=96318 RepID=X0BSU6_FUSOX|nr:hypothetical protein FOQG_10871 [Fusarium oxysporum f. sp. raphani 54005]KAG7436114.1 hypothetical protein Forpi1262_v002273 [Fusarium oxysporum f. sp. raphani]KAJ4121645.1 hypothetical protein NW769_001508 [Fusarium oxysporum]KAJ4233921.1 hypothetical protein NW760_005363 [Fusarium oxysporum]
MADLLFQTFPALSRGARTPQAIILRGNYTYDDTASHVPQLLRRRVPVAMKKDGKLHLYKNEEGFLYDKSPTGGWGSTFFIRNGVHLHVILPLNYLIIGKIFRPLSAKQNDLVPPVVIPGNGFQLQPGTTKLKRFIRTFWSTIRQDAKDLKALKLSDKRYADIFSEPNYKSNLESVIDGLVPEAKRFLRDGDFGLQDLLGLPDVTVLSTAGQTIYLRVYLHLDGADEVGLYIGQSSRVKGRVYEHEKSIKSAGGYSPHYSIARQSRHDDRQTFLLCFWSLDNRVSQPVMDMAEQTMISMFNTYHAWIASSSSNFGYKPEYLAMHNQCRYLQSVAKRTRDITGWQHHLDADTRGCNVMNPLWFYQSLKTINCFRMSNLDPTVRTYTTYRMACKFNKRDGNRYSTCFWYNDQAGKSHSITFTFPKECFQLFFPESGHIVFEIMDDYRPHPAAWFGCPSVGKFENFELPSCLGIRIEWLDEPLRQWLTVPITNTSGKTDPMLRWTKALTVIQLLEGITWSGPLNGLQNSIDFGGMQVAVLKIDHLQQKCQWLPRQRKTLQAPVEASWDQNFKLMAKEFGKGATVICSEPPARGDDFWKTSATENPNTRTKMRCDFCNYGTKNQQNRTPCERDPERTDIWVCKRCSEMNRPCTFTPITISKELWGFDEPFLNPAGWSKYPTGPHRKLAFHQAIPLEKQITLTAIPEPFGVTPETTALEVERDEEAGLSYEVEDIDDDDDYDDDE